MFNIKKFRIIHGKNLLSVGCTFCWERDSAVGSRRRRSRVPQISSRFGSQLGRLSFPFLWHLRTDTRPVYEESNIIYQSAFIGQLFIRRLPRYFVEVECTAHPEERLITVYFNKRFLRSVQRIDRFNGFMCESGPLTFSDSMTHHKSGKGERNFATATTFRSFAPVLDFSEPTLNVFIWFTAALPKPVSPSLGEFVRPSAGLVCFHQNMNFNAALCYFHDLKS